MWSDFFYTGSVLTSVKVTGVNIYKQRGNKEKAKNRD